MVLGVEAARKGWAPGNRSTGRREPLAGIEQWCARNNRSDGDHSRYRAELERLHKRTWRETAYDAVLWCYDYWLKPCTIKTNTTMNDLYQTVITASIMRRVGETEPGNGFCIRYRRFYPWNDPDALEHARAWAKGYIGRKGAARHWAEVQNGQEVSVVRVTPRGPKAKRQFERLDPPVRVVSAEEPPHPELSIWQVSTGRYVVVEKIAGKYEAVPEMPGYIQSQLYPSPERAAASHSGFTLQTAKRHFEIHVRTHIPDEKTLKIRGIIGWAIQEHPETEQKGCISGAPEIQVVEETAT